MNHARFAPRCVREHAIRRRRGGDLGPAEAKYIRGSVGRERHDAWSAPGWGCIGHGPFKRGGREMSLEVQHGLARVVEGYRHMRREWANASHRFCDRSLPNKTRPPCPCAFAGTSVSGGATQRLFWAPYGGNEYSPSQGDVHRQGVEQCVAWFGYTPRPPGSGRSLKYCGASEVLRSHQDSDFDGGCQTSNNVI